PPAGGSSSTGGAFTEPASSAGAGGHPAWDRGPRYGDAPGPPAPYQPPQASFRGTPPSPQSAIRRPPAERTGLLSNIPLRPILIGVGVIVVLIIIALTTHG